MKMIKRYALILLTVIMLVTALGGCKGKGNGEISSSAGTSASSQESSMESSAASQTSEASTASRSDSSQADLESSSQEENSQSDGSQGGEASNVIYSGDFQIKFQENPIDAAYQAEQGETTTEMVQAASKYAGIWEQEADAAYRALMEATPEDGKAAVQDDQEAWLAGKEAALDQIRAEAAAVGGSLARVTANIETMNFYRERAKELYQKLYRLQPDFTFAYQK